MTWQERIRKLFAPPSPEAERAKDKVSTSSISKMITKYEQHNRKETVTNVRKLVNADGRLKKILRVYSRDIARAGFTINTDRAPRAQSIFDDLYKKVNIGYKLQGWIRETLRDGDAFLAIYLDPTHTTIVDIILLPVLQTVIEGNKYIVYDKNSITKLMEFERWQVIHVRYDATSDEEYGRSLFEPLLTQYDYLSGGEQDLAFRRRQTSGTMYQHTLEGASDGDIEDYKQRNKSILEGGTFSVAHLFSNKKGSLEIKEPQSPNGNIEDVQHHLDTVLSGVDVPSALIGYGANLSRDVLGTQLEQYLIQTEFDTEQWVTNEIIEPLLHRALLLQGILPEKIKYEILWRYRNVPTPASLKQISESVLSLRAAGMKKEFIAKVIVRHFPNITYPELLTMIEDIEEADPNEPTNNKEKNKDKVSQTARSGQAPDKDAKL